MITTYSEFLYCKGHVFPCTHLYSLLQAVSALKQLSSDKTSHGKAQDKSSGGEAVRQTGVPAKRKGGSERVSVGGVRVRWEGEGEVGGVRWEG